MKQKIPDSLSPKTPKEERKSKFKLGGKVRTPSNPHNWKELNEKMRITGKLSIEDFRDVPDMMNFLDFYNSNKESERKKILDVLIREITEEVVKYQTAVPKKYIDQEIQKKLPDLHDPLIDL